MSQHYWPTTQQSLLLQAAILSPEDAHQAFQSWVKENSFERISLSGQTSTNKPDSGSPHPPDGHLLPTSGEKAKRNNVIWERMAPIDYQFMPKIYKNISSLMASEQDKKKLRGIYKQNWIHNTLRLQRMLDLLSTLPEPLQSQCLLMKGAAMTLMGGYDLGERVFADIDLLVSRTYAVEFLTFFLQNGFEFWVPHLKPTVISAESIKNKHALILVKKQGNILTLLDLHFSPLVQLPVEAVDEGSLFHSATKVTHRERTFLCLNSADLLLQVCVHGMKYASIPLFRWVMDAVTLIRTQPNLDWDRFLFYTRQYQFVLPVRRAMLFLEQQYPGVVPQKIISALNDAPVSLVDRVELYFWRRKARPLTQSIVLLSSRARRSGKSFRRFFCDYWGLSTSRQLFFFGFKKILFFCRPFPTS